MKKPTYFILALIIVTATSMALPTSVLAADNAAVKAMEEFLDFSEYGGGNILPEQIPDEDWKNIYVIDTRDADQYQAHSWCGKHRMATGARPPCRTTQRQNGSGVLQYRYAFRASRFCAKSVRYGQCPHLARVG